MNRKKSLLVLAGIIFISTALILILGQGTSNAQEECRMIKISGQPGGQVALKLEPDKVLVKKGTCVIWVNFARTDEVRVEFREGKVCEDATRAPVGFSLDAKNCYVTNFIPFGATSSLLFNVPGEFKYVLRAGVEKLNGKIIVTATK